MAKTIRQQAEFATYFVASEEHNQPFADSALAELNRLLSAYTTEGWVAMTVLNLGQRQLTLEGGGSLNGISIAILWTKDE